MRSHSSKTWPWFYLPFPFCKAELASAIEFERFPRGERKRVREKEAVIPKVENMQDENGRSEDAGVLVLT